MYVTAPLPDNGIGAVGPWHHTIPSAVSPSLSSTTILFMQPIHVCKRCSSVADLSKCSTAEKQSVPYEPQWQSPPLHISTPDSAFRRSVGHATAQTNRNLEASELGKEQHEGRVCTAAGRLTNMTQLQFSSEVVPFNEAFSSVEDRTAHCLPEPQGILLLSLGMASWLPASSFPPSLGFYSHLLLWHERTSFSSFPSSSREKIVQLIIPSDRQ